jgi:hypothetical protein
MSHVANEWDNTHMIRFYTGLGTGYLMSGEKEFPSLMCPVCWMWGTDDCCSNVQGNLMPHFIV